MSPYERTEELISRFKEGNMGSLIEQAICDSEQRGYIEGLAKAEEIASSVVSSYGTMRESAKQDRYLGVATSIRLEHKQEGAETVKRRISAILAEEEAK